MSFLFFKFFTKKRNNYNLAFNRAFCYPSGSNVNLTKTQFNRSPCATGILFNEQVPYDMLQRDYAFYGQSNYEYCLEDIREIFKKKPACTTETDACSFKDKFIADVKNSKFLVPYFGLKLFFFNNFLIRCLKFEGFFVIMVGIQ